MDSRETDPLLPGNSNKSSSNALTRLQEHLHTTVSPRHIDLILLFCYVITGLLDSSAVYIWGAFVSMQTGNTVYLGLGLASQTGYNSSSSSSRNNIDNIKSNVYAGGGSNNPDRWVKSGISIASFCLGSLCFAAFHRTFTPTKRWVLMTSFVIQMLCIVCAATIVTLERKSSAPSLEPLSWRVLVPLAMVAFQSSGQAVMSRVVKLGGLSSVVLTSVYCDLFSHPGVLNGTALRSDVEERRRLAAVVCLLIGALLGGLWARSEVGLMGALWTAVVLKVIVIVAWFLWNKENGRPGVLA